MRKPSLLGALLAGAALPPSADAAAGSRSKAPPAKNAILLSKVQSLTLHAGRQTTARRVPAIPQLTCHGSACQHHRIESLRCTNMGSSYSAEEIEWSCTASLPGAFKLGSTEVVCEGYAGPEDPYVLKGSCGVDYRLAYTGEGMRRYGGRRGRLDDDDGGSGNSDTTETGNTLFMILFFGLLFWILWSFVKSWRARRHDHGPGGGDNGDGGGGGGFGGWGPGGWGGGDHGYNDNDNDDSHSPPPPYPGKPETFPPGYTSQAGAAGPSQQAPPPPPARESWRPSFGLGLGALGGAAAGYAAGRYHGGATGPRTQDRAAAASPPSRTRSSSSSYGRSASSGSGSSSGARHESTGFGSTSRR